MVRNLSVAQNVENVSPMHAVYRHTNICTQVRNHTVVQNVKNVLVNRVIWKRHIKKHTGEKPYSCITMNEKEL